jgi:GWxTD domain-containing protein
VVRVLVWAPALMQALAPMALSSQPAPSAAAAAQAAGVAVLTPRDTAGMGAWRRYEDIAHGVLVQQRDMTGVSAGVMPYLSNLVRGTAVDMVDDPLFVLSRPKLKQVLENGLQVIDPPTGADDLAAAERAFRQFRDASPSNRVAWRHVFMAVAEHSDWSLLESEARQAIAADAAHVDARLVLGLALVRQQKFAGADSAFADARRRMPAAEWSAFASVQRMLQPRAYATAQRFPDSVAVAGMSPAQVAYWDTHFWQVADPRAMSSLNAARLEFFARMSYADLRFAYDAPGLRGADSDRGRVHVRYGPPDAMYRVGDTLFWVYRNGTVFRFVGLNTGRVRFPPRELRTVEDSIFVNAPYSWESMPLVRNTVPMRARAARFRAGADSQDVVIAAAIPVVSLVGQSDLAGALPIDVQLDVIDPQSRVTMAERRRSSVNVERLPVAINGTWLRRLGRGHHLVRLQAEQADVERSANALLDADVDSTSGFGMSDLLLGTGARGSGTNAPARWRDVSIAPTVGVITWSTPLSFVWETYELRPDSAGVRFRTDVELQRTFSGDIKGMVARVGALVRDYVLQDRTGTGRVSVSYDQTRATTAIATDYLSLNLSGQSTGTYRLTVTVTDLVTGQRVSRQAAFTLTKD